MRYRSLTIAAVAAGVGVGLLFGHNPNEMFFFIIIPIVGGGLAEGVLPLSIAYSDMLKRPQCELVALMVPAALLGNVVAIVVSGLPARMTEGNSNINGNGLLVTSGGKMNFSKKKKKPLPSACRSWGPESHCRVASSSSDPCLHPTPAFPVGMGCGCK